MPGHYPPNGDKRQNVAFLKLGPKKKKKRKNDPPVEKLKPTLRNRNKLIHQILNT